jgi:hypothetical protein
VTPTDRYLRRPDRPFGHPGTFSAYPSGPTRSLRRAAGDRKEEIFRVAWRPATAWLPAGRQPPAAVQSCKETRCGAPAIGGKL